MLSNKIIQFFFLILVANKLVAQPNVFTDQRDKQQYRFVKLGTQIWMAENLNFKTPSSLSYDETSFNADIYGQLYSIADAKTACPAGWHLPSDSEWQQLEKYLGMPEKGLNMESTPRGEGVGKLLKGDMCWRKNNTNVNEKSGFNALPGGCYLAEEKLFIGKNEESYFWTSTQKNKLVEDQLFSTIDYEKKQYAWMRTLSYFHNDIGRHYFSGLENYYSVRCVADIRRLKQLNKNGVSFDIPDDYGRVEVSGEK